MLILLFKSSLMKSIFTSEVASVPCLTAFYGLCPQHHLHTAGNVTTGQLSLGLLYTHLQITYCWLFKLSVLQNKKVHVQHFSEIISWRSSTFWKSTNLLALMSNMKLDLFWHTGFLHTAGWVYLNCCSTPGTVAWHSKHMNVPEMSSGCTGWVRTTWPLILASCPTLFVFRARILWSFIV